MAFEERAPVIVATAQHTWRTPDVARTPLDALETVAADALSNASCDGLRDSIDCLATVRFIMDSDPNLLELLPRNPGLLLAERLGINNASYHQTDIGGNTPQFLLNHFAERLAAGEFETALISGVELLNTFFDALRNGHDISAWRDRDTDAPCMIGEEKDGLNAQEKLHGLYEPINTYPIFESALRHDSGSSRQEQDTLTANLCAGMSAVASENEFAWRRDALSADEIATVTEKNRYIGFPYTRAMNAVLSVDMGAAIIMTTAGKARELGIPQEQWIYLRAGTDLNEIWHPSERQSLHRAPAIGKAVQATLEAADLNLADIARFDIYSCFPSAVRIACNEIGLSPLDKRGVTVTGGLPYFGGPGNNYSLHAIAEMVERLRREKGHGLVTANGLYLTKHSVGIYSSEPGNEPWPEIDRARLQQQIETAPRRNLASDPSGDIVIEGFTVAFSRNGPSKGFVIGLNDSGERVLANVAADSCSLERMTKQDIVGQRGSVHVIDGLNLFEF